MFFINLLTKIARFWVYLIRIHLFQMILSCIGNLQRRAVKTRIKQSAIANKTTKTRAFIVYFSFDFKLSRLKRDRVALSRDWLCSNVACACARSENAAAFISPPTTPVLYHCRLCVVRQRGQNRMLIVPRWHFISLLMWSNTDDG